ncbi:MAG: nuclear transport factor 2 family protein [Chloroflexota bacterium]
MSVSATDRRDIEELIARYNWAIDTRDGEGVAATFTADGCFTMRDRQFQGHEALVRFGSGANLGPAVPESGSQHWVTNLILEGDAERVNAKSYLVRFHVQGDARSVANVGCYIDQLLKFAGQWLFERREIHVWPYQRD